MYDRGTLSLSLFRRSQDKKNLWLTTKGFFRCGHAKCQACHFASITKTFWSLSNPELSASTIKDYINSNSKNIIYLITCQQCKLQYIGCTSNVQKNCIMHIYQMWLILRPKMYPCPQDILSTYTKEI